MRYLVEHHPVNISAKFSDSLASDNNSFEMFFWYGFMLNMSCKYVLLETFQWLCIYSMDPSNVLVVEKSYAFNFLIFSYLIKVSPAILAFLIGF